MQGSIRAIIGFLIIVCAVVVFDINVDASVIECEVIAIIGAIIMASGIDKIIKNTNF